MRFLVLYTVCFSCLMVNAQHDKELLDEYSSFPRETGELFFKEYTLSKTDGIKLFQNFYDDSSRVNYLYSLFNDQKNGTVVKFYRSGKVQLVVNYYYHYPIGLMVCYHKNGEIKALYDWGTIEESHKLREQFEDRREPLYYEITGEEIGDTLIPIPLKGKCADYYPNGCIQRVIVYENSKCAYMLLFDENEFLIKQESCDSDYSFCDFYIPWEDF